MPVTETMCPHGCPPPPPSLMISWPPWNANGTDTQGFHGDPQERWGPVERISSSHLPLAHGVAPRGGLWRVGAPAQPLPGFCCWRQQDRRHSCRKATLKQGLFLARLAVWREQHLNSAEGAKQCLWKMELKNSLL